MSSIDDLLKQIDDGIKEGSIDPCQPIKGVQTQERPSEDGRPESQGVVDRQLGESLRQAYHNVYAAMNINTGNFTDLAMSLISDVPAMQSFMHMMIGMGYFMATKWDLAIENFDVAVRHIEHNILEHRLLNYVDGSAYYFRGLCYWFKLHEESRFPETIDFLNSEYDVRALEDWKVAREINPSHPLNEATQHIEDVYLQALNSILTCCRTVMSCAE